MRGTLREKRPGYWELRIRVGRDPLTGQQRQVSRAVRGSRREAEKALAAFYAEVDAPAAPASKGTVGELLEAWLDHVTDELSPKTVHEYRRLIQVRIRPGLGERPVKRLDASEVDQFYRALQRKAGLAPGSVRHIHAILSKAFAQAVRWGWLNESPISRTSPPAVRRSTVRPPDPDDVVRLLEAAASYDPDLGMLLLVGAVTGARRGELCALRWADLDLVTGSVLIHRALFDVGGRLGEKDTKTHAARRLRLDAATVEALTVYRAATEERAAALGTALTPDAFAFSHTADGSMPIRPDKVTGSFRRMADRLDLTHVRLHDLRHFAATRMLAAGVPVRTVSGRLGHADASTTLGVYAHFVDASDQDAAAVMGRLVRRPLAEN